jgi:Dehydrogenases (flavoproteins)
MPKRDEVFCAYRAFHNRADGSPDAEYTNKAYLKHLGEKGISWCIQDPSGTVNVLIGRVAELSKQVFDRAYSALKADNPTISDEIVRGGGKYIIPIRYPLTRMVADGYVAIGDSAFMTIPMLGSGIENSMCAACILSEILLKTKSAKKENLWQYQVAYYKHIGARHVGIDVLKRWLLSSDNDDLSFLFKKKIVNDKIMFCGATGQLIFLSPKEMLDKVAKGYAKIGLLLSLNNLLIKTHKAERVGLEIPEVYDEAKISEWEKRIEKFFE